MAGPSLGSADPAVGLCSICRHATCQTNPRGSRFWRCLRAEQDPAYRRYPPLPVNSCPGFEPRDGDDAPPGARSIS